MKRKPIEGLAAEPRDELLAIDASIYLHRAWHSSKGAPGGVVRSFGLLLCEILDTRPPTFAACAFDSGLPSYRADEWPAYKEGRPEKPPEFVEQIEQSFRLAGFLGFNPIMRDRVEADDLIAGVVELAVAGHYSATIMTVDKDLAQLIGGTKYSVEILTRPGGEVRGIDAVLAKYGVLPSQIPDWLGLAGDSADNLPGVEGIGDKLAARLLRDHGTIEDIRDANGVAAMYAGPSVKAANFDRDFLQAILCRELARLRPDDLGFSTLQAFKRQPIKLGALYGFAVDHGLDDWTKALDRPRISLGQIPRALLATNKPSAARSRPEDLEMAEATSIAKRMQARKADQDKRRGKSNGKSNGKTKAKGPSAAELIVEILAIDDEFDFEGIGVDPENANELAAVLAELMTRDDGGGGGEETLVDQILALDTEGAYQREKLEKLSAAVQESVLRVVKARADGAGSDGVNPGDGKSERDTSPEPGKAKKSAGRSRTPPLPEKYGGKTMSKASKDDLRAYAGEVLGLKAEKGQKSALKPIVEAHLRGEELPDHDFESTEGEGKVDTGFLSPFEGEGPVVFVPGLTDKDDGKPVAIEDATADELAAAIAYRTVGGKADDFGGIDRDDLEFLALQTFASHAWRLEEETTGRAPAAQTVTMGGNLEGALAAAAEAFLGALSS